jgi:hypothetical protein
MGRPCSTNGAKRNAHSILVGKPGGKRPLERRRHTSEDNIKMDLRETGLIWLRIGTGGGLLRTQQSTFGFHKVLGNS